jgi:predicted esterase
MITNPNFLIIALRADRNQDVHHKFFNINTDEHPDLDLTDLDAVRAFINAHDASSGHHHQKVIVVGDSNGEGGPKPVLSITWGKR